MHTFTIADSSADQWSAFHRDAAAKDARKPPFVEKTARMSLGYAVGFDEAAQRALQKFAEDMGDEEAEELVRRYRANYGRK